MTNSLKYIDLFSGCGGLSLGLEKANYKLILAVEKSPMAAETFYHNFIKRLDQDGEWDKYCGLSLEEMATNKLVVDELRNVLDNKRLMARLKREKPDLIAGGPPCQGFSMAGRRNPKDARNSLPWQFLEMVEELNPKAVLMENVVGMRRNFVKHKQEAPFDQLREALKTTGKGYVVQPLELNAMHYGVPQHRPRVMLLGIRKDIAKKQGLEATIETWKSAFGDKASENYVKAPKLAPVPKYFGKNILTVKNAISDLGDGCYKRSIGNYPLDLKYAESKRRDTAWMSPEIKKNSKVKNNTPLNHVRRKHNDDIELRFRLYQCMQKNGIPSKVLNIPSNGKLTKREKNEGISRAINGAKFPLKSPGGVVIAKTKKQLVDLIERLPTKKHSQRSLIDSKPSPTVLSLPDDFVHPYYPRTMTVREMARFQSFPDSFEFRAKETTGSLRRRFEVPQYTQVGNAVAPLLAESIGKHLIKLISDGR